MDPAAAGTASGLVGFARPNEDFHLPIRRRGKMFWGFRSRWDDSLLVNRAQPPGDLRADVERRAKGSHGQTLPQRLAHEEFRDEERNSFMAADIVGREDIRLVQSPRGPSFLLEAPEALRIVASSWRT